MRHWLDSLAKILVCTQYRHKICLYIANVCYCWLRFPQGSSTINPSLPPLQGVFNNVDRIWLLYEELAPATLVVMFCIAPGVVWSADPVIADAAEGGILSKITRLAEAGAKLNSRKINEITPLEEDHESELKILTEAGERGKSTHKSGDISELREPPW